MNNKSKSVVKWLIVFGIIFAFMILLGESKTSFEAKTEWTSGGGRPAAVDSDRGPHVRRYTLPPLPSQIIGAALITLLIWFCTLIYGNSKKSKELRRTCDSLSDSFVRLEAGLRKELEELKKSMSEMKFDALRKEGKFRFTKDMPLTTALAVHPDVAKVLFTRGLACVSCPSAAGESIEQAAKVHGLDVQPILDDLNKLLEPED